MINIINKNIESDSQKSRIWVQSLHYLRVEKITSTRHKFVTRVDKLVFLREGSNRPMPSDSRAEMVTDKRQSFKGEFYKSTFDFLTARGETVARARVTVKTPLF
jgi:hypothetical protein